MSELGTLILENERLIYKIASYFPGYSSKEDLYQVGCKGMIDAYKNYNPEKGKFTTFAYNYILGEMRKLVREDKSFKVSRDISSLKNKIEKVSELLTQKLMREPSPLEIAEYLELPEYCIIEALNYKSSVQSIDSNIGDSNMMMHEIISSPDVDKDTLLFLKTELESLQEPEKSIMIGRYYEDLTQTEIANNLGLSQVDVSRREKKVLTKLRSYISG